MQNRANPQMTFVQFVSVGLMVLLVAITGAKAAPPVVSAVLVETFQKPNGKAIANPMVIEGSLSTLLRRSHKIEMRVDTLELPPGVYTIWWHIMNNVDVNDPNFESILWATYSIVDASGEGSFDADLREGEHPGFVFTGNGLLNAEGADVELFVRYHGPLRDDPEVRTLQITHPFGGCTDARNPLPTADDFDCYNPQIAIHLAP